MPVPFNCLWCGRPWTARDDEDLARYARLCEDCIGRAQDNEFLRFRLHEGLRQRGAAAASAAVAELSVAEVAAARGATRDADAGGDDDQAAHVAGDLDADVAGDLDAEMRAYYAARADEYDDWYLRRGRFSHGVLADMAWQADLDAATVWLDQIPFGGEIVELAAGTGWWSPLLAQKGALSLYDAIEAPLERARQRLVAHALTAHLHLRDAWAEPDRQVDALFCGCWLSHVPRARLAEFLGICRRWLKADGTFAFIDSRRDPESGATDHAAAANDLADRRLADGREFTIPKVYYEPSELQRALLAAGFTEASVTTTSRFFVLGRAVAG